MTFQCQWCSFNYITDNPYALRQHCQTEHPNEFQDYLNTVNKILDRPKPDHPLNSNLSERVGPMINETKQTYPTTTYPQFDEFFDNFVEECRSMRDTKGKEYAGDKDRFDNFNRLAVKNDIDRLKVANIYLGKHLDAIDSFIREGRIFSTESIRGRFIDAVTYLILMAGMVERSKSEVK